MFKRITIKNFKSIKSAQLDLGLVNVFVGENGAGKSNIIEAFSFASAAISNRLDNEFLASRGIRATRLNLMRSAFPNDSDDETNENKIEIDLIDKSDSIIKIEINESDDNMRKWASNIKLSQKNIHAESESDMGELSTTENRIKELLETLKKLSEMEIHNNERVKNKKQNFNMGVGELINSFEKKLKETKNEIVQYKQKQIEEQAKIDYFNKLIDAGLTNFVAYSPKENLLRTFADGGQILPLGVNGEGLGHYLKSINENSDPLLGELEYRLRKFSWFSKIKIEDHIGFEDQYISQVLDGSHVNEGFLYLLFYYTLILSNETPSLFAIDGVDNALNPKLCTKLMEDITELVKTKKKQVLLTAHNPAILDGLNVNDPDVRLFVVSRNTRNGSTKISRIESKNNIEGIKLSEAFMKGMIGGLPKGF